MNIVILGLPITSSWGNGHATTYRGLVRGLVKLGHDVLFLEREQPWYAQNRDLPKPPYGRTCLYDSLADLKRRCRRKVQTADLVIAGSYVPEGVEVGEWVLKTSKGLTAFYDIDTPVTLSKLGRGDAEYITPALAGRYDLYLSFTGGPTLNVLQRKYKTRNPRVLYCSVDPVQYFAEVAEPKWDLGYLGTYSADRQPTLNRLLVEAAMRVPSGRFVVAGPMYPADTKWPSNIERIDHLPPGEHRRFYNTQRFTLNVTRADMIRAGYSPSVRLFEAGACGTPIISDCWPGLEEILQPGSEILISRTADQTLEYLYDLPERERRRIGARARARILAEHTSEHRARQLEEYVLELLGRTRVAGALTPELGPAQPADSVSNRNSIPREP